MWVVQYGVYHASSGKTDGLGLSFHVVLWGGLAAIVILSIRLNKEVKRMIANAKLDPHVT